MYKLLQVMLRRPVTKFSNAMDPARIKCPTIYAFVTRFHSGRFFTSVP